MSECSGNIDVKHQLVLSSSLSVIDQPTRGGAPLERTDTRPASSSLISRTWPVVVIDARIIAWQQHRLLLINVCGVRNTQQRRCYAACISIGVLILFSATDCARDSINLTTSTWSLTSPSMLGLARGQASRCAAPATVRVAVDDRTAAAIRAAHASSLVVVVTAF